MPDWSAPRLLQLLLRRSGNPCIVEAGPVCWRHVQALEVPNSLIVEPCHTNSHGQHAMPSAIKFHHDDARRMVADRPLARTLILGMVR